MANDVRIVISADARSAIGPLQQVQRQVSQVDRTINNSTAALRRNATQYNATSVSINKFAKGALQQAGFQIGDYAVQVANGTSKMQAFGQQGAQMLGIFGPVGAVLGAAVAIFSAFAVAAERSGKEVANFGSVFGQLQEPLTSAVNSVKAIGAAFGSVMPFVVQNIDTALIAAGLFAAVVGVKMVKSTLAASTSSGIMAATLVQVRAALVASAISTGRFNIILTSLHAGVIMATGALRVMAAVLMRLLPVAVILGIAKAVEMFLQLRRGAGSAGEAFGLLRDLAIEVFDRIVMRGDLMYQKLLLGIEAFRLGFVKALVPIAEAFDEFANGLITSWNDYFPESGRLSAFRINITPGIGTQLTDTTKEIQASIDGINDKIYSLEDSLDQPVKSLEEIRAAFRAGEIDVNIFGAAVSDAMGEAGRATDEARQKMSDLRRSIESSMESAFMSIVDGTKSVQDAFRSMATEIIKELYRVLVVQRLVAMISGAIFGSPLAPASSSRPVMRPRALGGAISAGVPYMVGEKGPEMIVPTTSGRVIPNNQLEGGGQTINIVQNINVSTGVQQTVRAEIKQLMPQIAESAKSAVVDAKRRGGSYGRAFA